MNAIEFNNVSKKFKKGEKFDSFRDLIPSIVKGILKPKRADQLEEKEFWALKDVSFEVKKGETLGIIGPNGSGKSTTLKLLSRILRPTMGDIKINGRLSALIEVGAGFHPDLTGRENIYLNGAIIGMKRREIDKKFDEIVEFSGIGDFIDTPVKRYSSGMYVKLGFSVAVHMDPEILLIDEVLSVGDMAFQKKCIDKMQSFQKENITVIFISHAMGLVENLCEKCIFLYGGEIQSIGPARETIDKYLKKSFSIKPLSGAKNVHKDLDIKEIEITSMTVLNKNKIQTDVLYTDEPFTIKIDLFAHALILNPNIGVAIRSDTGLECFGTTTKRDAVKIGQCHGSRVVTLEFSSLNLLAGNYEVIASLASEDGLRSYDFKSNLCVFSVESKNIVDTGLVRFDKKWRTSDENLYFNKTE